MTASIAVPEGLGLVGSDLDGTLLNSAHEVGSRARDAIPRLANVEVAFAFVTGRPPRWLSRIAQDTGHRGYAVCGNGALLVHLGEERLIRATTIDTAAARAVCNHLRAEVPGISFALERLAAPGRREPGIAGFTEVGHEPNYDTSWPRPADAEVGSIDALLRSGKVLKILALPPPESGLGSDELIRIAGANFADTLQITHSGAGAGLIEIMSAAMDKGSGFLEVAELLGVDRERTAAVGDMPNDIPLLKAAGTSYAVGNAHEATRAVADHVIASNDEDGVGLLLEAVLARTCLGP